MISIEVMSVISAYDLEMYNYYAETLHEIIKNFDALYNLFLTRFPRARLVKILVDDSNNLAFCAVFNRRKEFLGFRIVFDNKYVALKDVQ